jgi:hypothetical protein
MVKEREFYRTRADGVNLYKTYSDIGMMLRRTDTGSLYTAAIEAEGFHYEYIETDIPIPVRKEYHDE